MQVYHGDGVSGATSAYRIHSAGIETIFVIGGVLALDDEYLTTFVYIPMTYNSVR